jgi:peptidoglycan/xylan/chitin deacetylase (PgdA/CDA1 family)
MLSFDDGWADNPVWAAPVMRARGAKASLALTTGFVNPEERCFDLEKTPEKLRVTPYKEALEKAAYGESFESFLTWGELERMRGSGLWDIQSHGSSHLGVYSSVSRPRGFYPEHKHWTMRHALGEPPFPGAPRGEFRGSLSTPLTALDPAFVEALKKARGGKERMALCKKFENPVVERESKEEFERRVFEDISGCRAALKDKLGIDSRALFWPWGHYSDASVNTAVKAGFELLFTMDKGAVTAKTDRLRIPRLPAHESFFRLGKQLLLHAGLKSLFSA